MCRLLLGLTRVLYFIVQNIDGAQSGCGSGKAELSADDYFGKKNAGEAKMSMDPREGFVPIGPFGSGAGSGVDVGKTRTKRGSVSKLGKAKHPKGMSNGPRGSCGDGVVTSAADAKKDKEAAASTAKDIGLLRKKLAVAEERIAALEESVRKLLKEKQEE